MNSMLTVVQETWAGDKKISSETICTCETYDGAINRVNGIENRLLKQGYKKSFNKPILFIGNLIYMTQVENENETINLFAKLVRL